MVAGTYLGAATDTYGHFIIVNVSPGVYDLQVSVIGYKKVTKTEVRVSIDRISTVNFTLESTVIEGEEVDIIINPHQRVSPIDDH